MNFEEMSKEELIEYIKNINETNNGKYGLLWDKEKEPEKIEQDLLKIFPKEYLKDINHLFVWHGRKTCMARTPNCKDCTVKDFCKKYKQENKS